MLLILRRGIFQEKSTFVLFGCRGEQRNEGPTGKRINNTIVYEKMFLMDDGYGIRSRFMDRLRGR